MEPGAVLPGWRTAVVGRRLGLPSMPCLGTHTVAVTGPCPRTLAGRRFPCSVPGVPGPPRSRSLIRARARVWVDVGLTVVPGFLDEAEGQGGLCGLLCRFSATRVQGLPHEDSDKACLTAHASF